MGARRGPDLRQSGGPICGLASVMWRLGLGSSYDITIAAVDNGGALGMMIGYLRNLGLSLDINL